MSEPNGFSQALALLAPVHRDGYKFVAAGAAATVLAFLLSNTLGLICLIATLALALFFRDPARVVPVREGLVVAPADGTVISIGTAAPPRELGLGSDPLTRVSIFLSVLDVHVCRSPVSGRIETSFHRPGIHRNAAAPEAPAENECHGFVIET
ncbi:MAG: phosphatidylserine decarboxylase, partial [Rhodomicrobium sp.]|nr:phosphatidylserine decarboxylase [Rhodomicrobium sp.]